MHARAVALLVLVAACNSSTPAPSPTAKEPPPVRAAAASGPGPTAPPDAVALRAAAAAATFRDLPPLTDEDFTRPQVPPSRPAAPSDAPPADAANGPPGRITVRSKTARAETSLTVDAVVKKLVTGYMAGMRRCYRTALERNPTLAGPLTLTFEVAATGCATSCSTPWSRSW